MDTSRFLKALNQIMTDRYSVKIEYEVEPLRNTRGVNYDKGRLHERNADFITDREHVDTDHIRRASCGVHAG